MLTIVRRCDADGYRWEIINEAGSVVDCSLGGRPSPEERDDEVSWVMDGFRHQEALDARLRGGRDAGAGQ
jgi:hypothetical protein